MAPKRSRDATGDEAGGEKKPRADTADVGDDELLASGVQVGIANAIGFLATSNTTVSQKVTPTLLGVTPEIRERILRFAVVLDTPLTPIQKVPRGNTFIWSQQQFQTDTDGKIYQRRYQQGAGVSWQHNIKMEVSAVPPLTAVSLALVCKRLYADVALTRIFYKENTLDFGRQVGINKPDFETFIVALHPIRRETITKLRLDWPELPHRKKEAAEFFTSVSSCTTLKHLHLQIGSSVGANRYDGGSGKQTLEPEQINGFYEAMEAVKGLKSLTIEPIEGSEWSPGKGLAKVFCAAIEPLLRGQMLLDRPTMYSQPLFQSVQQRINLDVDGEGRLTEDRKPGVISSRTRGRKNAKADHDGVIAKPSDLCLRYTADGQLNWYVEEILDSREAKDADGLPTVEFKIRCRKSRSTYRAVGDEVAPAAWEDCNRMTSSYCDIFFFYESHRDKPGMGIVRDIWKTAPSDQENLTDMKSNAAYLGRLEKVIAKAEKEQEAREKIAREAMEKSAKNAAKSKGKGKGKAKA